LRPENGALVVTQVLPDSPAAVAELAVGDAILKVANRAIDDLAGLDAVLARSVPGDRVPLLVLRDGERRSVLVRIGKRGEPALSTALPPVILNPGPSIATEGEAPAAGDPARAAEAAVEPAAVVVEEAVAEEAVAEEAVSAAATQPAPAGDGLEFGVDLAAAKARAKASHQPVLLVFGAEWSSSSQAFRRSLAEPEVQRALAGAERVWLDTDRHRTEAEAFAVQGLPRILILRGDEVLFDRTGYLPPAMVGAALREYGAGAVAAREASAQEQLIDRIGQRMAALEERMAVVDRQRAEQVEILRRELVAIRAMLRELK